jgi:hypothetical protein
MKYFISSFLPFMAFFYIKKPVYGYISLLFCFIAMVSWTIYPSSLLIAIIYVVLLLWSFFEINDYHSKLIAKKMIGYIREINPSIGYDEEDEEDDEPIPLKGRAKNWQNSYSNNLSWPNQKSIDHNQEEDDDEDSNYAGRRTSRRRTMMRGNNQEQAPVRYGASGRSSYSSRSGRR